MPFKRGRTYYIETAVPGIGRLPRLSTRQRDKRTAGDMESALRTLSLDGHRDLVLLVRDGSLDVPVLYAAHVAQDREAALQALRPRPFDPPLKDVVLERRLATEDERVKAGYRQLLQHAYDAEIGVARELCRPPLVKVIKAAPPEDLTDEIINDRIDGLRLSWLTRPLHLTTLYEVAVAAGRKPNTVRRSLHRAVSELLARRLTRGEMLHIMADVDVPGERDERVVMLDPTEIRHALKLADEEFMPVLGLAVTSGVDREALLVGRVRDYDRETGVLQVYDTKTEDRRRALLLRGTPVLENAEYWLEQLVHGKQPDEPLTGLTMHMIRSRWEALREVIGRKDVRWKDLRGVFATHFIRAGGNLRDLQGILGHADMKMSLRYVRRRPAGASDSKAWERLRHESRISGLPAAVVDACVKDL